MIDNNIGRPGDVLGSRGRAFVTTCVVLVACPLAGCVSASSLSSSVPAPPPMSSAVSAPVADVRAAIQAAYVNFWATSEKIDQRPEGEWEPAMRAVAVDPELTLVLRGTRLQHDQGIRAYGEVAARITSVDIADDQVTVSDCQDASRSGQADAATGKPRTVGVPRNPVRATLARSKDGIWKVATITYPGGQC